MSQIKVEYIDHMGTDISVVNAARVSFSNRSEWDVSWSDWNESPEGDGWEAFEEDFEDGSVAYRKLKDKDSRLINFLARERHDIPFAHTSISMRCSAPIPNRTQCFKSKVGFVENEESRRYISTRPVLFVPEFREAVKDKKQGSGGLHPAWEAWRDDYIYYANKMIDKYESMIEDGICPEQARYILPQGVMVNWIWTGSLLAYARFWGLRRKPDTQSETRIIADKVSEIMQGLYPVSWAALTAR